MCQKHDLAITFRKILLHSDSLGSAKTKYFKRKARITTSKLKPSAIVHHPSYFHYKL